ncbi:putative ubiquitin carboxyl-terminal hydrolase 50 [Portunus trituberculatus]|uniref:ubiquitinyl hydrolase 1 n=1 Tax=Portunus trituberculatus TaxID=210409 RepID=A0A5B7FUJ3_PORTR|nr:putative ubiquitin carboxyl-terminal hydrolase 50 [Portunus trituberculatus]
MAVRPSRKSEMTPTDPSRAQVLPLRSIVPSDTVSGDEQSKGVMRSTLYVELHDYSKSGGVKEVPEGSHRTGQKALQEASGDLGGSWQDPKGSRGVMGVKTSWMYKPVTGGAVREGGGQRGASGEKKDVAVLRGEKKSVDGGREERVERAGAQLAVSVNETGRSTPDTSYINATLQCLFTVPLLREFFREEFWQLRVQSEVARAVADTFLAMESGSGEERAMGRLHETVGRRDKVFKLHQDPPAADLLSCLLAWLHHDLAPRAHPQAPLVSSVVSRLFHGLRESLIVCPRHGILSSALESFNFITLSVPGEGAWTLQELLGRRFRPQDMAWECQPCGGRQPCSHKIHMLRSPTVLVLALRYPRDVATRVLFPDAGLSLALHHRDAISVRSPEYQLVGVVGRQSGKGSSRFSAYCRRLEGGRWGMWREGQVASVSRREVLSQQGAHLLFYLQCQQEEGQGATHRATREQVNGTRRTGGLSTCV